MRIGKADAAHYGQPVSFTTRVERWVKAGLAVALRVAKVVGIGGVVAFVGGVAITLLSFAVTGCSESPQQRAKRISQECVAVTDEVGRITRLEDYAKRNMVAECVFQRGKAGSP